MIIGPPALLERRSSLADTSSYMDLVSSIASFSTTQALVEAQFQAAAKILKISQHQGDAAVQLVQSAAENLDQVITDFAEQLGDSGGVDVYA